MKRSAYPLLQNLRLPALAGLVSLGLLAGTLPTQAKPTPFSHIVSFGTSLTDTGNYYELSGGYPAPPYVNGRYSNGRVWVEYLAECLRMDYQPQDNYAVAGATTGSFNINNGVAGKLYPGIQDEISAYLANGGVSEPGRALFIVEGGANDVFLALKTGTSPATLIGTGVNNTVVAVQRLRNSGARYIMVMNLPDLGVTPWAQSLGPNGPAMLSQLSAAYNQALSAALDELALAGIPTLRLDSFTVLNQMATNPAAYGLTNVTTPLIYVPSANNPDEFLFWDPVHPTTGAHEVLALEAVNQILEAFSPSNGRGTPAARVNALHGLVNASLRGEPALN